MSSIQSGYGRQSEISEQYLAQQAEKEKLKHEHEVEMERLKNSYDSQEQSLKDRFESNYQQDKLQSYENLRNSKKQFTRAEKNLMDEGEKRIQNKADELRMEENRITKEGTAKLNESLRKQALMEEYQRNRARESEQSTRREFGQNAQSMIRDYENKIENLRLEKSNQLNARKSEHGVAVGQIHDHYDQKQTEILQNHEKETSRIQQGVDDQINRTRLDQALKLDESMKKQDDPFYQMARVESEFMDQGDHYQLIVRVPEHERKGFRVQISGQELQLSGMRSSNQNARIEDGHEINTNSFQSFSERYRFDTPVDAKSMQVSEKDGWLHYTIPKYGPKHRMKDQSYGSKVSQQDLQMSREMEFRNTLPVPRIVKNHG